MQIPDEIRKCVAFLGCRRNSGDTIGGTAFFVGVPIEGLEGRFFVYAVTARHVIEEIKQRSTDGIVYCRVNGRRGGVVQVPLPLARWTFNEDARVDVAVALFGENFDAIDQKLLPLSMFLDEKFARDEEVGVGDDLFFPGLFSARPGEEANIPIVRTGNIAAMPQEPIRAGKAGVMKAPYLVEARSIGGLSGSPVFWHRGFNRLSPEGRLSLGPPRFRLIGLVHGHYENRGSEWDCGEATMVDVVGSSSINMGIAIVVPASDIKATLDVPSCHYPQPLVVAPPVGIFGTTQEHTAEQGEDSTKGMDTSSTNTSDAASPDMSE